MSRNQYSDIDYSIRIGETKRNKQGSLMKIIEYNSYSDIIVEFLDYPYKCHSKYGEFKNGGIKKYLLS